MKRSKDEMPPRWAEVYIAAWQTIGGGINARMSDLRTADREEVAARCAREFGSLATGWRIFVDAALDAIGGES
jgi:hypothetical protein